MLQRPTTAAVPREGDPGRGTKKDAEAVPESLPALTAGTPLSCISSCPGICAQRKDSHAYGGLGNKGRLMWGFLPSPKLATPNRCRLLSSATFLVTMSCLPYLHNLSARVTCYFTAATRHTLLSLCASLLPPPQ